MPGQEAAKAPRPRTVDGPPPIPTKPPPWGWRIGGALLIGFVVSLAGITYGWDRNAIRAWFAFWALAALVMSCLALRDWFVGLEVSAEPDAPAYRRLEQAIESRPAGEPSETSAEASQQGRPEPEL